MTTKIELLVTVTVNEAVWEAMADMKFGHGDTFQSIELAHVRTLIIDTLHEQMSPPLEALVDVEKVRRSPVLTGE